MENLIIDQSNIHEIINMNLHKRIDDGNEIHEPSLLGVVQLHQDPFDYAEIPLYISAGIKRTDTREEYYKKTSELRKHYRDLGYHD